MRTLPIARSLRLALIGLTVVLAVIAALGVASVYGARQSYDNTLQASSSLSTAAANLAAAGIAEQEILRDARGPDASSERLKGRRDYDAEAATAGADLYLTKPFSPLDLLRLIDRVGDQPR